MILALPLSVIALLILGLVSLAHTGIASAR